MRETLEQKVNKFIGQKFGEYVKAQIVGSKTLCQAERDDFCAVSTDGFTVTYLKETGPVEPRKIKPETMFRYEPGDPHCVLVQDKNEKKKHYVLMLDNTGHVVENFYLRNEFFRKAPDDIASGVTYSAKYNTVTWWYGNNPIFAAMLTRER